MMANPVCLKSFTPQARLMQFDRSGDARCRQECAYGTHWWVIQLKVSTLSDYFGLLKENAYQQWSRRTNHLHLLQLAIRPRQRVSSTSATVSKDAPKLTHFDSETGRPKMVSVSNKASTHRDATAVGTVEINSLAQELLQSGQNKKGDVLTVAQLAGIMGAKQTSNLIPLCHPLYLSHVSVELEVGDGCVNVKATAETEGNTGVEMEALTAVQVACLTVWDMLKAVSGKDMCITNVKVVSKSGGKSGDWTRDV